MLYSLLVMATKGTLTLPMATDQPGSIGDFICVNNVRFRGLGLDGDALAPAITEKITMDELRELDKAWREHMRPIAGWKLGCCNVTYRDKAARKVAAAFLATYSETLADRKLKFRLEHFKRRGIEYRNIVMDYGYDPAPTPESVQRV